MRILLSILAIILAVLLLWDSVGDAAPNASAPLALVRIHEVARAQEKASSPASDAAAALAEQNSTVKAPATEAIDVSPPQQDFLDSRLVENPFPGPQPALSGGTESQAALLQARRSAELHLRFPVVPTLSDSTAPPVSAPPVATPHR